MTSHTPRPIDARNLTDDERQLARWMLEHGDPGATSFVSQVDRVRVVSRCYCGCASIDFVVPGLPEPTGGLRVLGGFLFGSKVDLSGIFIFEKNGTLAGIEVYALAGEAPKDLPLPSALRTFDAPDPD